MKIQIGKTPSPTRKLNKVYIKLQDHIDYLEGVNRLGKYSRGTYGALKRKTDKLISESKIINKDSLKA